MLFYQRVLSGMILQVTVSIPKYSLILDAWGYLHDLGNLHIIFYILWLVIFFVVTNGYIYTLKKQ